MLNLLTSTWGVIILVAALSLVAFAAGFRFGSRQMRGSQGRTDAPQIDPQINDKEIINKNSEGGGGIACATTEETVNQTEVSDEEHHQHEHFLQRCHRVIEQHIDDPEFSIMQFAAEMHLSHSVLVAKLRRAAGIRPVELITKVKMQRAAELILSGEYEISSISCMVGFSDPKYFSRVFKKHFGVPPSQYLQQHSEAQ